MKQLEIITFEKHKITVVVKIDYIAKTISLVEDTRNQLIGENRKVKSYIFAGRNAAFMPTWLNILDAMSYAVKEAKKLLDESIKEEANFDSNTRENIKKKIVRDTVRKVSNKLLK